MSNIKQGLGPIPRTKLVALISVLAGLYAVGSFLPGFPMFGVAGSKIDLVRALEIGYGLILGPVYGPITAFIGALAGKTLTGGGVGLYFTPLAPITAYVAANMRTENGWKKSAGVLLILILIWYVTPVGRKAYLAPILHLSGLAIIAVFGKRVSGYLNGDDRRNLYFGVLITSFPSTLSGHLAGNIIYANLFSPAAELFNALLPISTVERLMISLIATILGVPMILAIRIYYPELLET